MKPDPLRSQQSSAIEFPEAINGSLDAGQGLGRMGVEVTVVEIAPHLLSREAPAVGEALAGGVRQRAR